MQLPDFLLELINYSIFARSMALVLCLILFVITNRLLKRFIRELGHKQAFSEVRILYTLRIARIGLVSLFLTLIALLLDIGYGKIALFLSSVFAVVGIALFAQWSILSNITASMIIFFSFPYRVGDNIKIVDKDDDISGIIEEISSFHVILRRQDGNKIIYPNTLILQKAVIKLDFPLIEKTEKK